MAARFFLQNIAKLFFALVSFVLTADAFGVPPAVNIADLPPLNSGAKVHPNVVLSLSTNLSMVGIAYRGEHALYNKNIDYIGYFNHLQCYVYVGGNRNTLNGYFAIAKAATVGTHECGGDSFSGNFMNWAALSLLDIMRYSLTGGDRVVDTSDVTMLQRAVLPEQFYANDQYFPRRSISEPHQVTPFNIKTLYIVSCRNRILFSDTKDNGGNCDTSPFDLQGSLRNTDKKLGEYLVRVKVCDEVEGPVRSDLCHPYGSKFKPVGALQRQSEKIRFAAMGYLLDNTNTRYGGVLRAPMKYIGNKKVESINWTVAQNDKLEWDPATGVLYANPEDASDRNNSGNNSGTNSGVINYINKSGRNGTYKELDPISELYYEGLRYLQGKQPTPESIAGMTDAMKDGFPVVQTWLDPMMASCQKNIIVSIGDANTHWDRYVPGNQRTTYNNGLIAYDPVRSIEQATTKTPELDVKLWTRKVGELEADTAGVFMNAKPRSNLSNLDAQETATAGHGSYYMAGLAYWANTNDIRLDKPTRVKTFTIDVDEGGDGLIDSKLRTIKPRDSQLYLAAKYGGFNDKNNDGNPFITFADDGKTIIKGSNAEWDASGNGIPSNYFLASQPSVLIDAVGKIFSSISNTNNAGIGVSVSSSRGASDGVSVFQAGFDANKWSGSLKKFKVSIDDASGAITIAKAPEWDAAELLTGLHGNAPIITPNARRIYTAQFKPDHSMEMVEFTWEKLNATTQATLNLSPHDNKNDGLGRHRVQYLRGSRDLEQSYLHGQFRQRDRILGDIINSAPVFVGAPALHVQGVGYQQFYEDNKARTKAVYVGANDGMLHAFNADDGTELFAYIPSTLVSTMSQLTLPEYAHRSFVDGSISVAEAKVGTQWKSVLVAGMGGGAQGVFALDVTNPSNFASGSGAIWEFTDKDDPDMGNLLSLPVIAKFKTKIKDGVPEFQYFAVVAGGLNNYVDDGANRFDTKAPASLFLLSLNKAPSEQWQLGVNYYKWTMPITDPTLPNGLATPALVNGSDGAVRFAYAGDLQGNLWRFDFRGSAPWSSALGASQLTPLFKASDAEGRPQPITTQPRVVFAPGGGYVVLFGTGKLIEVSDTVASHFHPQSFYAIHDSGNPKDKVTGRGALSQRKLNQSEDGLLVSGTEFIYGSGSTKKSGWYLDFVDSEKSGERSVSNALLSHGRLFFNTIIPNSNPCAGGSGRTYSLDVLTGLSPANAATGLMSTVGLLGAPTLFEVGTSSVGERNAVGLRNVVKRYSVVNFGSEGVAAARASGDLLTAPAGRLSWREILNWLELKSLVMKK